MGAKQARIREHFLFAIVANKEGDVQKLLTVF